MLATIVLRWLTLLGVLYWFVVYWRGGREVVNDIRESVSKGHSRLDTLLMVTIALCSAALVGTSALILGRVWDVALPGSVVVAGVGWVLSLAGIGGMFYSRAYLGKYWTAETTVMREHRVVDEGPYGVVRHPIYSCAIVMYVGLGIAFPVWWNLALALVIVVAYALKAWDEERFLEMELAGYREYEERVRYRVVPWLW